MQAVTAGIGLAVPGRPIRSLVAEDRSAVGVRDRTGTGTPMLMSTALLGRFRVERRANGEASSVMASAHEGWLVRRRDRAEGWSDWCYGSSVVFVLMVEVDADGDQQDEDRGGDPVDDEAERRPPASVGNIVAPVLPKVLEPMAGEAEH
jgi:hypothetical protein